MLNISFDTGEQLVEVVLEFEVAWDDTGDCVLLVWLGLAFGNVGTTVQHFLNLPLVIHLGEIQLGRLARRSQGVNKLLECREVLFLNL